MASQPLSADVAFSSSVLPRKPGLGGSLQLPLGFILNNMSRTDDVQRLSSEDMNICLTCGSYLNPYSRPDTTSGIWTCCICQAQNATSPSTSQSQAVSSTIVEYEQEAAGAKAQNVVRGSRSGIGLTSLQHDIDIEDSNYNAEDPTMIVLDSNVPPIEINALLKHLSELNLNKVGLIIYSNMMHIYQVGLKGIASADVYSPTLDPTESGLETEDRMYFGSFEEIEYCANAFFGTSGMQNVNHSDVVLKSLPDNRQPMSRKEMLKLKREARSKREQNTTNAFDGFDPNAAASLIAAARSENNHSSHRKAARCTGEAAEYALHLIHGTNSKSGRILLFTNGCSNIGKGSLVADDDEISGINLRGDIIDPEETIHASKYMHSLGQTAFKSGVGIDVFCSGNNPLGAAALLALVKPSGGYVLSHDSFEDYACYHDITFIFHETRMSRAISRNSAFDVMGLRMNNSSAMNLLNGVIVDLRMPSFIVPKLYHGSGSICKEGRSPLPNELSSFARCASIAAGCGLQTSNLPSTTVTQSILTQIQLGRYDSYSNISITMQLEREIPGDSTHIPFQFVSRYVDPIDRTKLITRVLTVSIAVGDESTYMSSLNDEVIPILLAKEAAFRSMVSKLNDDDDGFNLVANGNQIDFFALNARKDLDETVHSISTAYRSYALSQGSHNTTIFPAELSLSLQKLHHFRRGIILGAIQQSIDDRMLQRAVFLRSPLDQCTQMTMPSVWKCIFGNNGNIKFSPVPAETLILWDNSVLAVDACDYLFVWSGKAVLDPKNEPLRKACFSFLFDRSKLRFPAPSLLGLFEGDPMCRKLTTRLVPSHGDSPHLQIAHFPPLQNLSTVSINSLRSKFRLYDPNSDPSLQDWCNRVERAEAAGNTLSC